MASSKLIFYLTCLLLGKMAQKTDRSSSVHQESGFIPANVGESVTLRCSYEGEDSAWLFWYTQSLGQKPRLVSSFYVFDTKITFHDEFKDNPRFKLDTEHNQHDLTIQDLQISDSATYYCASSYTFNLNFAEGATVNVRGAGVRIKASVHQSESIQPGGSVTLNCTVHTETCDGEHRVYWFKNSEESHPGFIYTKGRKTDQCERKPNTHIRTCVYNLPMKSLNLSHAGIYYCAVASCGRILFGNGTKLNIKHEEDEEHSHVLVYFLSGALTFTTILGVLLAFSVCKAIMRNNCQWTAPQTGLSAPSTRNTEDFQDADSVHYAAFSVKVPSRSRTQRNTATSECVYSSVKR
ncbi:uncharacterized protein [Embiotoca jacksoni]|uniref:uncharacterized protein n=1 Tax=Embiotoca jacksoni TaxID=100190 RepID=UPI003703CD91